jgi:hypothetical protein
VRRGSRDLFGVAASLAIAGGGGALLRWRCDVPSDYGAAAEAEPRRL